tara:strand:+ start:148 stop:540 length:393 start_codon:yes stop_codon:yes gene_type:complete
MMSDLSYEKFNKEFKDEKDLLNQVHDDWIRSGPSTLASEMIGLIEETKRDKGFVLSQEAAMMACVESKRNDVLIAINETLRVISLDTDFIRFNKEISESLSAIARDTESFASIEGIANILSRMEQAAKRS